MPITFFKDCKKYYRLNDEYISDQGKIIGGFVGSMVGTLYGAGLGQLLESFHVDRIKGSFVVTEITSTVGFFAGAALFKYLTKPISLTFAILETGFDRVVSTLDYFLEFEKYYDQCNAFLEDKTTTRSDQELMLEVEKRKVSLMKEIPELADEKKWSILIKQFSNNIQNESKLQEEKTTRKNKRGISTKAIMYSISAGVGTVIGPYVFSNVGQFVAPNLVFGTDSRDQNITLESLGLEYGHILGAMLVCIAYTPIHKALSFSGAFTFSLLRTLFYKPALYLKDRCCPDDDDDDEQQTMIEGSINGTGDYVPPALADVAKPEKSLDQLKAEKRELKKQIKELESKEQGKPHKASKKSKKPSGNNEASTEEPTSSVQVRLV